MAEQQNVLIKILADVAGANASFGKLQKTLANLSGGTITLAKNMNAFEQGVRGSIGAQKAAEQVSKAYLQTMRQRLNISRAEAAGIKAIAEMHRAEAAAINAKIALRKAELAGDQIILREMQQELQLRRLSIQEIELENRARRALTATTKASTQATTETNNAVKGLSAGTGSASFALLSLGQAFQDSAQFGMGFAQGFRAINNNIQQTFTAIALGSVQMGGFKNLMSAMAGSLWGPGGLILGFSAVSAAVEFFTTRAQRASKEARNLNDAWVELANVIPTENIGEFNISQVELEKRLAAARTELEKLSKQQELQKMAAGFGQMALTGNDASGATAALQSDIDRLTEALDKVNKSGENYVTWATSIAGLQALSAQTTQDFEKKIADLEAQLAMSGEFVEFEQRISDLQDAIASGLGFDEKDPAKVIATLNTKYEEFLKTLREMGSSASVSREEFAKMLGEDALGKFLADEQWKVTVKNLDAVKKESNEIAKAWEKILGTDGRMTIADLASKAETELIRKDLSAPESFREINETYREYIDNANAVTDANQQIRESMAQVASDLLVSFATMGGGFDMFLGTIGRFLSRYGAEMVQHGVLTSMLGVSVEAVKEALSKLNGKAAIVAGLALVAIGSRLRSNARNASRRLQGGGGSASSGRFTAPSFGAMSMVPTIGQGSVFQSQQFSPVPQGSQNVQLVASGRSLVSVVGSEMSASSRRVGGTPVSFSGVTASSGVFVDINRDDLVK